MRNIVSTTARQLLFSQQSDETGLLEMLVTRERLGEAAVPHDEKRQAIDEAPFLVQATLLQFQRTGE